MEITRRCRAPAGQNYRQVMNMGDYDDVLALVDRVGEDQLRHVLTHAEIGQFNARSWTYWHYRLSLTQPGQAIPMLPKRQSQKA